MSSTTSRLERPSLQPASVETFASALRTARETNRQIVPIVGAGLSADCGFPVIAAIMRYFGKLYRYIEEQAPLRPTDVEPIKGLLDKIFAEYRNQPWRFVEDFGWPDRFQLNQDLYALLGKDDPNPPVHLIEDAVREGLHNILPLVNPQSSQAYDVLCAEIKEKLKNAKDVLVRSTVNDPAAKENALQALDTAGARLGRNRSKSAAFDIIGDWRRLILSFTNYRSDYADALFARFGSARQPGQGHRFLAFLVKFLAVPTVFTFNFDSLIEQAMESEGVRPRVFAMERGAGLPHARLVRDHLSVIKMHGSTHALLLDERLDRPLSEEYLQRFGQITGSDPLLLVVGCSESDRRLRDLVTYVVRQSSRNAPSVLWLHYETKWPSFLEQLMPLNDSAEAGEQIRTCQTNNPGATLQHLYSWLTSCHPAGRAPYIAHVQQPVHRSRPTNEEEGPKKNRFELISSLPRKNPSPSASHELLKRANHWARNGYQFIWIDLEAVHTFAGVVGSIIDQCRKYDPDLAPSVLPVDVDGIGADGENDTFLEATIKLAAQRVARALRRARYYLALDGLETYAWPATTHHGLSHMAIQRGAGIRLESLGKFLRQLERESLGESLVGISIDNPISRHNRDLREHIPLEEVIKDLDAVSAHSNPFPADAVEVHFGEHFEDLAEDRPLVSLIEFPDMFAGIDDERKARFALALFNLSCFRRMRPLVAVRHLLKPLLGRDGNPGDDAVEQHLQPFIDKWNGRVLQQLEGGGYWFARTIRNKVYAENTRYADTENLKLCLDDKTPPEKRAKLCRDSAFQLSLAAMTHQRIARTWYTHTFMQSEDTFSFLEYTYHRISSVRSLVKLRRLVQVAGKAEKTIAKAVLAGIENWNSLDKLVGSSDLICDLPEATSNSETDDALTTIAARLKKRHRDELGSLYRAWTRSEVALRTQVPAEQLLHWCHELLTDDLEHRCNRVVIHYGERAGTKEPPQFHLEYHEFEDEQGLKTDLIDQELQDSVIREFRHYFQDLQAKLWIERSDYQTCIRARWRHLIDNADNRDTTIIKYGISREGPVELRVADALEKDKDFIASCDVVQCHRLLDIVNCKLQLELESSFNDKELIAKRQAPRDLLDRVRERLVEIEKSAEIRMPATLGSANILNEAWLRLVHLQAENQMGRITVFSHDGFTAKDNWMPKAVELHNVERTISEGLERIRTHDARTHQAPRSVVLDPTTDGALYLQYRTVFYMFKGRTQWLGNSQEGFQNSQRSFQMARGGLGSHSPLMSALIEMYSVEALLGRARNVLFDAPTEAKAEEAFKLAQGLYDSARGGLQRARESLLASRRNVIWRKLFFGLTSQYHSDRLLLDYVRLRPLVGKLNPQVEAREVLGILQPDGRFATLGQNTVKDGGVNHGGAQCEELLRHFLLRLRRAYHSLLTAVDLYLPQSTDQQNADQFPNRFHWLYRLWWELTLCGYATGRLALSLHSEISDANAKEYVTSQLEWLNETGGITASELGRWVKGKYQLLDSQYQKIDPKAPKDFTWQGALKGRRTLLHLAMTAADGS